MLVTRFLFQSFAAFLLVAVTFTASLRAQENETLASPIVATSDSGAYHAINQLPESMRSSAPFAREFYEFARHAGTSGTVDNAAYLSDFEQAQQDMLRANARTQGKNTTQATEGTWSNIGITGSDSTPSAGITTAIVFDPQHTNILYAGSFGGIWKSNDTGTTWSNLTDNILPNLSVATIAIDPVNTQTLYVGTGYCINDLPNYGGTGVYKSTDGGQTFSHLNVSSNAEQFVKIAVDPIHDSIVIAVSYDQATVYRSTDFGTTWKSVFANGQPWDVIATPGTGNAESFYVIGSAGVYKSTNDGLMWVKSSGTNFPSSIGRCALASPTKAPNKVFALMTDPGGTNAYFYESTDTGKTWAADPTASMISDLFSIPNANHYQGWYDLYLSVSPNSVNDDTIYAGGVVGYEKSGGTWQEFSDYNHSDGGNGYPHVDHHSFAFNPNNSSIVYDGDDGGLWINYAAGSNDVTAGGGWNLHSLNMVTNRLYHFAFDKNNLKATWAGAQDQGLWKITNETPVHYGLGLGDCVSVIVSSSSSNLIYAEGPEGQFVKATLGNSVSGTADTAEGVTDACGWENPIAMSPVVSSDIYIGRQHLWQSTNSGTAWKMMTPSFGNVDGGLSYCTAIGLPNWNVNIIYAAGGGSSFQLSTNMGTSWVSRTNPGYVTSINTSWQDPKFVVVSLANSNNKVMMSEDSGHTWTNVSGVAGAQIPGAGANQSCNVMYLAIDSTDPLHTWYAATDFGVYQTTNQGQAWSFMGPGLFPCRDVQIAIDKVTMRVATYGRGEWEVQLPIVFSGVESTTLSATRSSEGTNLAWNVEGEPSGAAFYVERSIDGDAFARIGSIAGLGAASGTQNYSFADNSTTPGTYLYQIHEIDANGAEHYSNRVELHYGTNQLYLYQPYPNPFIVGGNPSNAVTLNFEIPAMGIVQIRIYDVKGMLVRTLLNRTLDGGPQSAAWDARDDQGNTVAPGAYFYSIQTATSGMASGKIMVVRE